MNIRIDNIIKYLNAYYIAFFLQLFVTQKPISKASEPRADEDNEYQVCKWIKFGWVTVL